MCMEISLAHMLMRSISASALHLSTHCGVAPDEQEFRGLLGAIRFHFVKKETWGLSQVISFRKVISFCSTAVTVTAPDRCYCSNQASLTCIKGRGRAGEFPVGEDQ